MQAITAGGKRTALPRAHVVLLALVVLLLWGQEPAVAHVRAAALLARFAGPAAASSPGSPALFEVEETWVPSALRGPFGEPIPARLYAPRGREAAPGVVLVHGVHRLGIEEPRLQRFARAVAGAGVVVMTPLVRELADYRIEAASVSAIGGAARALRARVGAPVGVMGMSFGGGLALLAAADPRFAGDVGFVVSVGGHHDLARVGRFFTAGLAERPGAPAAPIEPHPYGILVFVYGHPTRFFSPADAAIAREATRRWLWEEREEARALLARVSPQGRARLEALWEGRPDASLKADLREALSALAPEMDRVSPAGKLGALRAPVFVLHGEGDTVIPSTEAEWIARELGPRARGGVHVSPSIVHVELSGEPPLTEKLALVHFMADVLTTAGRTR